MRLPRDLSGAELIKRLSCLGYVATRRSGSHVRLTHPGPPIEHHLTVPLRSLLRLGTLNAILQAVAAHLSVTREGLLQFLS